MKLALMDESGVFLETQPLTHSQKESESEIEAALAEANRQNSELSDQLADAVQKLDEEKAETARLTEELARVPTASTGGTAADVEKLKEELRAAKERYKRMWRMTCEQSREQEELLATQQEEINRLKSRDKVAPPRIPSPTGSAVLSHGHAPSEYSRGEPVSS